ncbi:MAG: flagellar export protein FliJ [Gammaproteobacteria bacterium]|nr:flagellar export protein FliJ [Gammaproteobacteria bacterium]
MKRSKRLQPVVMHAKNKEQDAARIFVQAQQRVTDSEEQLQQLESFREDYLLRYKMASQQLGSMSQMLDYQAFLAKLNKGIGQANQTIHMCRQQRDILKQQWLQHRVRSQALENVVEKYQHDENKQLLHLEQMELEEFSQQRFHHKSD